MFKEVTLGIEATKHTKCVGQCYITSFILFSFIHSLILLFIFFDCFIHLLFFFIRSFIRFFILSLIQSFFHSFINATIHMELLSRFVLSCGKVLTSQWWRKSYPAKTAALLVLKSMVKRERVSSHWLLPIRAGPFNTYCKDADFV